MNKVTITGNQSLGLILYEFVQSAVLTFESVERCQWSNGEHLPVTATFIKTSMKPCSREMFESNGIFRGSRNVIVLIDVFNAKNGLECVCMCLIDIT